MRSLPEVQEAKSLMREAMEWSLFTWLFQKHRVREVADRANAALDKLNRTVKSRWSSELKAAYQELRANGRRHRADGSTYPAIDPEIIAFLQKIKECDDAARRARSDAQATFDEAERQLNTGMARDGCRKAIHQWELDERAIRRAEAFPGCVKQE